MSKYGHDFGPSWRANLALRTALHAPESTDLYSIGGNTALHSEVSRQGQLVAQWHTTREQLMRLSAFENDIGVFIDYHPLTFQAKNVNRSRIRGAELEYEWRGTAWQVPSAYTVQDRRI